jgi:SAM-dependent methyltransferase
MIREWWMRMRLGVAVARGRVAVGMAPVRPMPYPTADEGSDPEGDALLSFCRGRGVDVGCGHRKVAPQCIGVDLLPRGAIGRHGVVAGQASVADICASGDDLNMFADGELDFVVARHYIDVVKTLEEWRRVLKPGGTLAVIVPDERGGDTIFLDPTHKHAFTPESLERLFRAVGGFRDIRTRSVVAGWSFLASAAREKAQDEA